MPFTVSRLLGSALLVTVLSFSAGQANSPAQLALVRYWVDKAAHTRDPVAWANDLMRADAAAEKLESEAENGCCGVRCIRVGTFELHYRFNPIAGQEDYQHDLLQIIASVHSGSKDGAEALVRLLPTGCQTIADEWTPYFRKVLSIIEAKAWRNVGDLRLTQIRGEAYETWWSLSKMPNDDPLVTDSRMSPEDFRDGASLARARAVQSYETLIRAHRASADVIHRLAELKAGRDTNMRKWVCYGD